MDYIFDYILIIIPAIKLLLEIIAGILTTIFAVRIWVIVRYHHKKIREEEIDKHINEKTPLQEKINSFLFREK